ncbi:ABC transporter ATP-binding protein [Paenibacillus sp. YN15]|uniref:ABC transporter ATP-binding protein n=1 Tax=Paenibacillus sp. YN15 TaxID=1742774 RepID=UPI000DCF048F|nr:ABC transporter ATP-binding protein [Paenibacillus sp. YN15]RAU99604.1 bacitracin ABC transporter ATP-binding protein [Paenibacillus sp. YN15]
MKEWIVETTGLTKRYGKRFAVDGAALHIGKGDIYGFLGPNGAGKTTTIRMLLGLIRPTGGTVRIFGRDLRRERLSILRRVGSLVESPSYYGHLTARENLEAQRRVLNVSRRRIDEVLAAVRLSSEANRPVKGFSLGMKQRLGIAAAMLAEPELLILDEPTNGLDPSGIHEIRELIKSMPQQYGMTVLVSSHLLGEIELTANRVGIIRRGRLVFEGEMEALRKRASGFLRLAVSQPERAQNTLALLGHPAVQEPADGGLVIDLPEDKAVARLVKNLVEEGHSIYRLEERRHSLEDIFLDMVGKESIL